MAKDKPPPPGTMFTSVQRSSGINPPLPALPRAADNPPVPRTLVTPPRYTDPDFSLESPEGFNIKNVPDEEIEIWPPSDSKRALGDWLKWVWNKRKP